MDLKKIAESKKYQKILMLVVILVLVFLIFQVGVFVGLRKAEFSFHMGDNYYRAFNGGPNSFGFMGRNGMMGLPGENLVGASGAIGKIIKIQLPKIFVEDRSNIEKTITVESETLIRSMRNNLKSSDLKVGDFVTVIGEPNESEGTIDAKLIRVIPPTPITATTSTN